MDVGRERLHDGTRNREVVAHSVFYARVTNMEVVKAIGETLHTQWKDLLDTMECNGTVLVPFDPEKWRKVEEDLASLDVTIKQIRKTILADCKDDTPLHPIFEPLRELHIELMGERMADKDGLVPFDRKKWEKIEQELGFLDFTIQITRRAIRKKLNLPYRKWNATATQVVQS